MEWLVTCSKSHPSKRKGAELKLALRGPAPQAMPSPWGTVTFQQMKAPGLICMISFFLTSWKWNVPENRVLCDFRSHTGPLFALPQSYSSISNCVKCRERHSSGIQCEAPGCWPRTRGLLEPLPHTGNFGDDLTKNTSFLVPNMGIIV